VWCGFRSEGRKEGRRERMKGGDEVKEGRRVEKGRKE
jgi:hypothetical protein